MSMEKHNVIETGRTPQVDKQADQDAMEKAAVKAFGGDPSPITPRTSVYVGTVFSDGEPGVGED